MVIFYKKWKKYNEIQLTKTKWTSIFEKMTNHPPSPRVQQVYNSQQSTGHGRQSTGHSHPSTGHWR